MRPKTRRSLKLSPRYGVAAMDNEVDLNGVDYATVLSFTCDPNGPLADPSSMASDNRDL